MNADDLIRFSSEALMVCMLASMPTVVASAAVGLLVAIVQAVMSLQDQSISYGIKLLVVSAVLVLTAGWAGAQVVNFAKSLITAAFYQ
ncbi:MAG: EscS/YscS/HrcS family type III secretion system export apparatus protein [Comamonadaceae bacterium]|nr:MAG: EscS/YscS/HrcS family type III secretion system export apparatus protein [Comamonadaceae bacterium]